MCGLMRINAGHVELLSCRGGGVRYPLESQNLPMIGGMTSSTLLTWAAEFRQTLSIETR